MKRHRIALFASACLVISACGGGTKLVRQATPAPQSETPIAAAQDATIAAQVDWVLVRNGKGAWARNADWDEYLLRVGNTSDAPVTLVAMHLVDSMGHEATTLLDRKNLVAGSRDTARRYRSSGIKLMAGRSSGTLLVAGVGMTAMGMGAATIAVTSSALGAGAGAGAGAATAVGGLFLAGPVLVGMGIKRAINNHRVGNALTERATALPIEVQGQTVAALDVFFPITPSPQRLSIDYRDAAGLHRLDIDTSQALSGLHLPAGVP